MSDMQPYEPQWHPIDLAVYRQMGGVKMTAWLLWALAGGVWANAAYLYPKSRWLILIAGILGAFVTLGLSAVAGILFGWLLNFDTTAYRAHLYEIEEQKYLRQQALNGGWVQW